MCGICGEIRFDGGIADAARVGRMTEAMAPRGPDGAGVSIRQRVGLGHRRLKIIDLSDRASQPMHDPALGLSIAFNGCIYNYRALRDELEGQGAPFLFDGDTEVILRPGPSGARGRWTAFGMFALRFTSTTPGRVICAAIASASSRCTMPDRSRGAAICLHPAGAARERATSIRRIDRVALHHY